MKKILILFSIILACGCTSKPENSEQKLIKIDSVANPIEKQGLIDSTDIGKKWLIQSIESFFQNYDSLNGDFSKICTKNYFEYKTDATNVDLDGGLSLLEFRSKWKNKNLKYSGVSDGFMISGSDFGKIKVTSCDFQSKTANGSLIFKVLIEDLDFKSKFYRDIILIPSFKSFLIDDVIELKNEFDTEPN
jgi:hypothetical protein